MTTTTTNPCEAVTEAVALGEGIDAHAAHVETCETCRATVATAAQLAATRSGAASEPAIGFSARMTVGAQQRFDTRRRRRIVGGLGGAVVAAALGVFVVTRAPADDKSQPAVLAMDPHDKSETPPPPDDASEAEALATLVRLSDVEHNQHLSARWGQIARPVAPYRRVISKGQK